MTKPTHIYQIKPVKLNLYSGNIQNQTKPTKPYLQNQTYQTKPTKSNQTYKTKISKGTKSKRQNWIHERNWQIQRLIKTRQV